MMPPETIVFVVELVLPQKLVLMMVGLNRPRLARQQELPLKQRGI